MCSLRVYCLYIDVPTDSSVLHLYRSNTSIFTTKGAPKMKINSFLKKRNIAALASSLALIAVFGSAPVQARDHGAIQLAKPRITFGWAQNSQAFFFTVACVPHAISYAVRVEKGERTVLKNVPAECGNNALIFSDLLAANTKYKITAQAIGDGLTYKTSSESDEVLAWTTA